MAGCSFISGGGYCGNWGYYYPSFTNTSYGILVYLVQNNANSTQPMSCIKKDATVQFTRTGVQNSLGDAAKDNQCVAEFGSSYRAASKYDMTGFVRWPTYRNS